MDKAAVRIIGVSVIARCPQGESVDCMYHLFGYSVMQNCIEDCLLKWLSEIFHEKELSVRDAPEGRY